MKNIIISLGSALALFGAFVVLSFVDATAMKILTIAMLIAIGAIFVVFGKKLKLSNPIVIATTALVVMSGVASVYAISGQVAMYEFSKIVLGFLAFLLVMLSGEKGRTTSTFAITTLFAGIYALCIEGATFGVFAPKIMRIFFGSASASYQGNTLTSIFGDSITIAISSAVLIFIALYTYLMAEHKAVKIASGCYMVLFAYTFFICANVTNVIALAIGVLVFAISTNGCVRPIVSTMLAIIIGAVVAVLTASGFVSGVASGNVLPILFIIVAFAVFNFADKMLNTILAQKQIANFALSRIYIITAFCALISIVYIVAGLNFTTSARISEGDTFERVFYVDQPSAQFYIELEDNSQIADVKIFARNEQQIASGRSAQIAREAGVTNNTGKFYFEIPEGTLELRMNITNNVSNDVVIKNISIFEGESEQKLPLNYILLSDVFANSIYGITTNYTVNSNLDSFANSLKLLLKSPVIGNGLGGYENGAETVSNVSTTTYSTSSYLQLAVDLGVLGFAIFACLMGAVLIAIKKGRMVDGLNNIFLSVFAVLLFGILFTNILASAEGVVLLFVALALVAKDDQAQLFDFEYTGYILVAPMAIFALLFAGNVYANNLVSTGNLSVAKLEKAITFDVYENQGYMLSYVKYGSNSTDEIISANTDKYLQKLENSKDSSVKKDLIQAFLNQSKYTVAIDHIYDYLEISGYSSSAVNTIFDIYFNEIYASPVGFENRMLFAEQASDFVSNISTENPKISLSAQQSTVIRNIIATEKVDEIIKYNLLNSNLLYDSKFDVDLNADGFGDYVVMSDTDCNINDSSTYGEINQVRIKVPYTSIGDYRVTFNGMSNPSVLLPNETVKCKIYNDIPVLDINTEEMNKLSGTVDGYIDLVVVFRSASANNPQITIEKLN